MKKFISMLLMTVLLCTAVASFAFAEGYLALPYVPDCVVREGWAIDSLEADCEVPAILEDAGLIIIEAAKDDVKYATFTSDGQRLGRNWLPEGLRSNNLFIEVELLPQEDVELRELLVSTVKEIYYARNVITPLAITNENRFIMGANLTDAEGDEGLSKSLHFSTPDYLDAYEWKNEGNHLLPTESGGLELADEVTGLNAKFRWLTLEELLDKETSISDERKAEIKALFSE